MDLIYRIKNVFACQKDKVLDKALACKGWTSREKLSHLYELAKSTNNLNGDILEIGSAWGRSTVLLGLASNKTIWSIDPHTGGVAFIRRGEIQESFDEFKENLKKHKIQNKVKILRNTTADADVLNLIPDGVVFSMVFIDGLHTADGVKTDFNYAYKRLVDSGVMVFDDYFEPTLADYTEMIDKLVIENSLNMICDERVRLVYFLKNNGQNNK